MNRIDQLKLGDVDSLKIVLDELEKDRYEALQKTRSISSVWDAITISPYDVLGERMETKLSSVATELGIDYEEIIVCAMDQDVINDLSHAYHDPLTGKYFHDRDEADEYDQIMSSYDEEELANYVEEFGTGYKPWMGHA